MLVQHPEDNSAIFVENLEASTRRGARTSGVEEEAETAGGVLLGNGGRDEIGGVVRL